jgi:ABC-type phosphate/phosphonate transport system substrate-binding protein
MAMKIRSLLAACAMVLASNAVQAQAKVLNFAVQPTYSPEQIAEVYKPFLAYLQKTTGYQIKLVTFRNFTSYWQEMRERRGWDLTFDEAHFTDYRIQRMGFEPLVRAAESGAYVLASSEDLGAGNTDSLLAEKIATLPAPSLGYALLLEYYPNPMQQPDVRTNSASFLDAIDAVFAEESRGAMVPASVAMDYPNLFEVIRTREYAGIAVSASSTLPADVKAKIAEALLKMHEDQDAFAALDELGISQFVKAVPADFRGAERVLNNFYGYGQ